MGGALRPERGNEERGLRGLTEQACLIESPPVSRHLLGIALESTLGPPVAHVVAASPGGEPAARLLPPTTARLARARLLV